jgi:hypothetical protein
MSKNKLWLRAIDTADVSSNKYGFSYRVPSPANTYLLISAKKLRNICKYTEDDVCDGVVFEQKGHKRSKGVLKKFFVPVSVDEFVRAVQNPEPGLHEAKDGKIVKRAAPAP